MADAPSWQPLPPRRRKRQKSDTTTDTVSAFEQKAKANAEAVAANVAQRAAANARGRPEVADCVEINQCAGCTRQFFTKSFLGDDVASPAPSSGEAPTPPRYRAGVASMAWRSTRRFRTNAP